MVVYSATKTSVALALGLTVVNLFPAHFACCVAEYHGKNRESIWTRKVLHTFKVNVICQYFKG